MSTTPSEKVRELYAVAANDAGTTSVVETEPAEPTYADRLRARTVAGLGLTQLPPPRWLVDDVLPAPGVGMIYAPPKAGKTFVAIDLACSVAQGRDWLGRAVTPGRVMYVIAEGVGGVGQRLAAWADYHGSAGLENITWVRGAVPLNSAEAVAALCELVAGYDLVIFDTLARCAVGVEENSAKDMGQVVENVDRIRDACGGHVLLVHHSGKDSSQGARGSSALLGAVDVSLKVAGGDYIAVSVEHAKDSESGHVVRYNRLPVGDSLVLVEGGAIAERQPKDVDALLNVLRETAGPEGLTTTQWAELCEGTSRAGFFRSRKWLHDRGQVANIGTERSPRYVPLTPGDTSPPTGTEPAEPTPAEPTPVDAPSSDDWDIF